MFQPTRKSQDSLRYDSGWVEISRQAFTNPEELALDITATQGGFVEVLSIIAQTYLSGTINSPSAARKQSLSKRTLLSIWNADCWLGVGFR